MFEAIRSILAEELGLCAEEIKPDSCLCEELGISQIELVNLLLAIEEEFQIRTDEESVLRLQTVDEVSSYIEALVG